MPLGLAGGTDEALSIVVLLGGPSPVREVYLAGGKRVADALFRLGHRVTVLDFDGESVCQLLSMTPDLVYNALHGGYGEDGCISGLLDVVGLPYTHSGIAASSIGMNKVFTKHVLRFLHIDHPEFCVLSKEEILSATEVMPYPFVIKPISGGSTLGVCAVFSRNEYLGLAAHADVLEDRMIVEKYVSGQEIQTAVFMDRAIGTMEFLFDGRVYSYDAKYTEGLCRHIFPANIPSDVYDLTIKWASKLHRYLGCKTLSRVDFRYDGANRELRLLEINTHPGMTACSAFPEILQLRCGLDFDQVVDLVVKDSIRADGSCGERIDALMELGQIRV